jgi:hypothetical protein
VFARVDTALMRKFMHISWFFLHGYPVEYQLIELSMFPDIRFVDALAWISSSAIFSISSTSSAFGAAHYVSMKFQDAQTIKRVSTATVPSAKPQWGHHHMQLAPARPAEIFIQFFVCISDGHPSASTTCLAQ